MRKYCLKRILSAIPVLLGISIIAFFLGAISPGDPAEMALNQNGLEPPTPEALAAMRAELGLDRPLWEQYLHWLENFLQGDLGKSYINGRDIAKDVFHRIPVTMVLAFCSLTVAGIWGIAMGVISAVKQESTTDNFLKSFTNILLAVPGFWLAMVLILVFSENLRWLPTSGVDGWQSFILPSIVLASGTSGTVARYVRGLMLHEFSQQYFLIARVRGISVNKLILKYALPNAIIPVIALLGNYFAGVLGGSVIVESIFAIPGLGSLAIEAIRFRDYPLLQAYVLVSGWILVMVTLAVDLLIAYFNPKVKLGA